MHKHTRLVGDRRYVLCHLLWLLAWPSAGCIDGIDIWNALHEHGHGAGHDHGGGVDAGASHADAGRPCTDAGASTGDANTPLDAGGSVADASTPPVDGGGSVADAGAPSVDAGGTVEDASTPPVDAGSSAPDASTACQPDCQGRACGPDGCGGSCSPGCGADETCQADGTCAATTHFSDVWPLLDTFGCPSCHVGSTPPAGLNLSDEDTAFANLVGVTSSECGAGHLRVSPGDPSASYVINKLEGTELCAGQRMPRGGPFMPDAQIDVVRTWITDGAQR